jgi:hypothetical protein
VQNAICWHINKAVKATISFIMSICREKTAATGWIVVEVDTGLSNQKPVKKSLVQVRQK